MINGRIAQVAMGMALAITSTTVLAERSGWYFGISGGQAQADLDQAELDEIVEDAFFSAGAPVLSGSSTLEDSDTSWSAFGGYQFSSFVAVEAGYVDFGAAEYRATGTVNPPGPITSAPASYSADFELTGFTLAVIGAVPVAQVVDLNARLGMLFADTEATQRAAISAVSASDTLSTSSRDLFFGLGLGVHLGDRWTLNIDWQQYKDVGDEDDTGETDVDRLSLGLTIRI